MTKLLDQALSGFSQWLDTVTQPRSYVRRGFADDGRALRGDFKQVGEQLTGTLEQHGESLGYRTR